MENCIIEHRYEGWVTKLKNCRNEIQQSCAQKIQLKQKERREATAQDNIQETECILFRDSLNIHGVTKGGKHPIPKKIT